MCTCPIKVENQRNAGLPAVNTQLSGEERLSSVLRGVDVRGGDSDGADSGQIEELTEASGADSVSAASP